MKKLLVKSGWNWLFSHKMPNVIPQILMRFLPKFRFCSAFTVGEKKRVKNMAKLGWKHFTFSAEKKREKYGKSRLKACHFQRWKCVTLSTESINFFNRVLFLTLQRGLYLQSILPLSLKVLGGHRVRVRVFRVSTVMRILFLILYILLIAYSK